MNYMSPEQLKREIYGKPCDLFAIAITVFIMIIGKHPFQTVDENEKKGVDIGRQKAADWNFPHDFPKMAEDFILKLGCLDPKSRFTAAEGLGHPFITRNT